MTSLAGPPPGQRPQELSLYQRMVEQLTAAIGPRPTPRQASEQREPQQLLLGEVADAVTLDIRAFSVLQPFGWLLAAAPRWPMGAGKTSEIRTKPTRWRGRVIIHVAKRWVGAVERMQGLQRARMVGGTWPEPTKAELTGQLGKAIAIAELVGCRPVTLDDPDPWVRLSVRAVLDGLDAKAPTRHTATKPPQCFAWQLERVRPIEPLALEGSQGLWRPPANLEIRERSR